MVRPDAPDACRLAPGVRPSLRRGAFAATGALLFPPPISSSGAAIAKEEYVPTNTPMSIAKAKPCTPGPPKRYSVPTASSVVPEVRTVRLIVWLIESLTICGVGSGRRPLFSRMRSKTMIVSLSE